jgi:alkanesulfonate monooxygenase SsuD/methylene tetrahydromethanopterin reductase-like flavin-dependent oxidoreductase (luciferase family)
VGVQLPEVERRVGWAEYAAMAHAAEEVGFDSIWLGDHLVYRGDGRPERGPHEAWTLLAGLAAVTSTVHLGPLVACASFHPPGVLAKMATTVQEVSGGRLILGIGAGWNRSEFEAFGVPYDHRAARFEEAFEIVRRLLVGERVTVRGRFWSANEAMLLPAPSDPIPLMIGSTGPRVLAATLPWVDRWNTWFDLYGNSPDGFAAESEKVTAAARSLGRDPAAIERSACVLVVTDRADGGRPIEPDCPPVEGPPRVIAARLRQLAEAGADEAILVTSPITERAIRELGTVLAELDD